MFFTINDIVASISLFQLGVFLIFLLHKGKRNTSNLILALFFFTQLLAMVYTLMFSLKHYTVNHFVHFFFIGLPSSFLWAPLLYFYIKSLIVKNFSFKVIDLIHLFPFLFTLIFVSYYFHFQSTDSKIRIIENNLFGSPLYWFTLSRNILVPFYNVLSLFILFRYEISLKHYASVSESRNLNWIKFILYVYIAACLVNEFYVFTESFTSVSAGKKDLIINTVFLIFFNLMFYKAIVNPHIFIQVEDKPKYISSMLKEEDGREILDKLENYMVTSNDFLIPTLTIKELSKKTGIPDRAISQVINQFKEQNFSDFINSYRVNRAKELLLKRKPEKTTMLAIALDSGFNSRNAFNEVFKKHTSISPTEFRKQNSI